MTAHSSINNSNNIIIFIIIGIKPNHIVYSWDLNMQPDIHGSFWTPTEEVRPVREQRFAE
jgi:hypothetical protein